MHGDAFSKAALYKDRFLLLSQMLSRHKDFSKPAFDSELSDFGRCEVGTHIVFIQRNLVGFLS